MASRADMMAKRQRRRASAIRRGLIPPGYVYFIVAEENMVRPMVKIGFSSNPPIVRLKQCQCGSPAKLRLAGFVHGPKELEEELQVRFQAYGSHREWFFFE